jgi:predicted permease
MSTTIWNDLKCAGRSLAKARAFTFVCVVSLGIGMVPVIAIPHLTRIFTIPPAGVDTDGLVEVLTSRVGSRAATDRWSYPDYADLRDANTGMTLVGWTYGESELSEVKKPSARAMFVSTNYFPTIGLTLARGPGFAVTGEPAVILGYRYWQIHFAYDPEIIGKTLTLDGVPHVVVGIAPDRFDGHTGFNGGTDVFLPLERHPRFRTAGTDRSSEWVLIHGRLAPGVTVTQASAAVATVTSALAEQYPSTNEQKAGIAAPWSALGVLASSQVLVIQAIALTLTGMVLLVVCLNMSGMAQVRSAMRERELSIRQAIGATRLQLFQYVFSEALIMAAVGATLASIVLFNLPSILPLLTDEPIPPQALDALKMNLPTIAVCVALCLMTSLVCGLLPAARFSRPVIISALKDDAGVGGRRAGRVHRVTAALQVAVAVPLIVMSGISLDRFRATATADLGFASDLLYAVPLKIDDEKIANADFRIRSVRGNLSRADGVAAATLADGLPLDFRGSNARTALQPEANVAPHFVQVHVTRVDHDYLNTMGIPLLGGRGFSADDRAGTELVTVISKKLSERLFPNAEVSD